MVRQDGQQFWVFQAAAAGDGGEWPKEGGEYPWAVKTFREELRQGDEVAIWQPGPNARLLGFAKTISGVQRKTFFGYPLSIRYRMTGLCDSSVTRDVLLRDPVLRDVRPFRSAMGGIFRLAPSEWRRLSRWRVHDGTNSATQELPPPPVRPRRPMTLNEYKKAFSYVLREQNRRVSPDHFNHQRRLKQFLADKKITSELEKDFIDLKFSQDRQDFIGEVKITREHWLQIDQAFRSSIGQLLDYAHVQCEGPVKLIMFLDDDLDASRVELASKLGISVVVEKTHGHYTVCNPKVNKRVAAIFRT